MSCENIKKACGNIISLFLFLQWEFKVVTLWRDLILSILLVYLCHVYSFATIWHLEEFNPLHSSTI